MKKIKLYSGRVISLISAIMVIQIFNSSVYSQVNCVRSDGTAFFSGIKAAYNSPGSSISAPHVIEMFSNYTAAFDTLFSRIINRIYTVFRMTIS